jgi:hypothetical protein
MPDAQVANAGVASGKVFERSFLGGPRAAWGSQNPEGEWPCSARGADPLGRLGFLMQRAQHADLLGEGVAGRNVPLRRGAEDAQRLERGEEPSSLADATNA